MSNSDDKIRCQAAHDQEIEKAWAWLDADSEHMLARVPNGERTIGGGIGGTGGAEG